MKTPRSHPLRLARRLKQFNLSLVAALAALALTACGGERTPQAASSSIARGVQQILQPSADRSPVSLQQPSGRHS